MRPNVTTQIQRVTGERMARPEPTGAPQEVTPSSLLLELRSRLAETPNLQLTVEEWGEDFQVTVRKGDRYSTVYIHRNRASSQYLDEAARRLRQGIKANEPPA